MTKKKKKKKKKKEKLEETIERPASQVLGGRKFGVESNTSYRYLWFF